MSEPADALEPTDTAGAVLDAPADQTPPDNAADDALTIEAEALAMGWKPKDGFKGPDDKFVDAAEYVRRGKEIMPFLKKELALSTGKIAKLEKTLERFAEHHSKTEQRMYAKALQEVQDRIDQAAHAGDVQGVRDATDELVGLTKEASGTAPKANDDTDEIFEEWKAENAWYGKDTAMTAAANAIGNELFESGMTGKAQAAEVTKRIKAEFPHKFENPNRRQAAAVEGGGSAARKTGKSYSDLPADARAACDDFVKRVPGFTREKYLKDYFA